MTYRDIEYEVHDPVAIVTLNRPNAMNAWTPRMDVEVRHAVARAEADRRVVGIVITGAGRAFCAGADIDVLSTLGEGRASRHGPAPAEEALDPLPDPPPRPPDLDGTYTYLLACRKPIVAAVNGAIAGMAVPIALCCDVRYMAEDAPLVTAFSQRGLVAEWGSSWLLPRLVGSAVALDLLLASRRITGEEAAALGVVNEAMPAADVLPRARQWVEDVAARCSPASMATIKRQVYEQLHAGLGSAEREAYRLMRASFDDPDFREGVDSFRERRPPRFRRLGD